LPPIRLLVIIGWMPQKRRERNESEGCGKASLCSTTTLFVIACLLSSCGPAPVEVATFPGVVTIPYPTVTNLGVEWEIEGDDNLNGRVTVSYRANDDEGWREGLPLRRVPAGRSRGTSPVFRWRNKHSGSIFDLRPDTEYEIRLILDDPDGGSAERIVRATTRPVPRAPANATVRRVTPETIASAAAGEVLELAAGYYGAFEPEVDGEPDNPIVYRSVDGRAVFRSVSLKNRRNVYLEGLTIRGSTQPQTEATAEPAVELVGAKNCVVRRCMIRSTWGIVASNPPGAENCYIADNVVEGINVWRNESMGADGSANVGEGIRITGPGNVIAHNRVIGFRDNISLMEEKRSVRQIGVDIYNNDVYRGLDDGIEADFCWNNCRVLRNRITNCYVGVSSQPGLGGPTYFIRNVMYNVVHEAIKLQRWSVGDVALHNTAIKAGDGMTAFSEDRPFDFALFRNNLFIGGPNAGVEWGGYGAGAGRAVWMPNVGPNNDFDYDAVGTHETPFIAEIGGRDFFEVEPHGLQVDMDTFNGVEFPSPPIPERAPPDLRPQERSAVVDAAQRLPNINDVFLGQGPDVGAYEAGQPLPIYGPRPRGIDEAFSQP